MIAFFLLIILNKYKWFPTYLSWPDKEAKMYWPLKLNFDFLLIFIICDGPKAYNNGEYIGGSKPYLTWSWYFT